MLSTLSPSTGVNSMPSMSTSAQGEKYRVDVGTNRQRGKGFITDWLWACLLGSMLRVRIKPRFRRPLTQYKQADLCAPTANPLSLINNCMCVYITRDYKTRGNNLSYAFLVSFVTCNVSDQRKCLTALKGESRDEHLKKMTDVELTL